MFLDPFWQPLKGFNGHQELQFSWANLSFVVGGFVLGLFVACLIVSCCVGRHLKLPNDLKD
jgi:hypothetical protein